MANNDARLRHLRCESTFLIYFRQYFPLEYNSIFELGGLETLELTEGYNVRTGPDLFPSFGKLTSFYFGTFGNAFSSPQDWLPLLHVTCPSLKHFAVEIAADATILRDIRKMTKLESLWVSNVKVDCYTEAIQGWTSRQDALRELRALMPPGVGLNFCTTHGSVLSNVSAHCNREQWFKIVEEFSFNFHALDLSARDATITERFCSQFISANDGDNCFFWAVFQGLIDPCKFNFFVAAASIARYVDPKVVERLYSEILDKAVLRTGLPASAFLRNSHSANVLMLAAEAGQVAAPAVSMLFELCLARGVGLDETDMDGNTVPHFAVARHADTDSTLEDALVIKSFGFDFNTPNRFGYKPLHTCSDDLTEKILTPHIMQELALSLNSADLHVELPYTSPLMVYCLHRPLVASLKVLIGSVAQPEDMRPDSRGLTPLMHSLALGVQPEVSTQILLEHATRLQIDLEAPYLGKEDVPVETDRYLQSFSSLRNGMVPLEVATLRGLEKVVKLLIDGGASLEKTTAKGTTLFHLAAQCSPWILDLLLDECKDKRLAFRRDDDGSTPLDLLRVAASGDTSWDALISHLESLEVELS